MTETVSFNDKKNGLFEISKEAFNSFIREKYNLTDKEQAALDKLFQLENEMSDRLIDQFYTNMASFKENMPNIYEQFKDYKPKESFEFFCTESGVANIHFLERNIVFYNSLDPKDLCNKQVDSFLKEATPRRIFYSSDEDVFGQIHQRYTKETYKLLTDADVTVQNSPNLEKLKSASFIMLLGLGLGYAVESLYSKIEIANLAIIEPNADLFFASLYAFDWASLLEFIKEHKLGLYLMIGQSKNQVVNDLLLYLNNHGKFLASCSTTFVHYIDDDMKTIADDLIKDFDKTYAALGFFDDHLFGVSHGVANLLAKKGSACCREKLPDNLTEVPVFVIGNGPSLDNDLPFIRKFQDKAIIIACGSSIDTLYNEGIKPDFYAATERVAQIGHTLDIFNGTNFLDDIMLIAGDVVHPETTKHFKRCAIFAKKDEPLCWAWLHDEKLFEKVKDWDKITLMNPLVGNLGVSSAIQFGFNNIFLFGIDNGKKVSDARLHANNSTLYTQYGVQETVGNFALSTTAEGNFGDTIETNYIYKLSADYIDKVVRILRKENENERNIKVYNCSAGIKLETCTPMHSENIDLSFLPDLDKSYLRATFDEKMSFVLDISEEEIHSVINANYYRNLVNMLLEKMKERPKTRLEFSLRLQECAEILAFLNDTRDRFYAYMIDGSIQNLFIHVQNAIYSFEDEKKSLDLANEVLDRIVYLLEDSIELFKLIPKYIMNEHEKLTNYKVGFDHEKSKAPDCPSEFVLLTKPELIGSIKPFVKRYE